MGLRHSYTLLAPIYDTIVESATMPMRVASLERLKLAQSKKILISGIGTGLDIPLLPQHHTYTAIDITPAMLKKCEKRLSSSSIDMVLHTADAMKLPFKDNSFDIVQMNLILAVVPEPARALKEAVRVVKPGGKIFIMDKFLKPQALAPVRRLLNIFIQHIATRTDVVFEELLDQCEQVKLVKDKPSLLNGWFRLIDLEKVK